MRFGEFLVQQGAITTSELLSALETQRQSSRNLALLEITGDTITEGDLVRIDSHQKYARKSYVQCLLELRILTEAQVDNYKELINTYRIPLGEILQRMEVLSRGEVRHWHDLYEVRKERTDGLVRILSGDDSFAHFTQDELITLTRSAHLMHVQPGELIYAEDTPADAVYIIETGMVFLSAGSGQEAMEIGVLQSGSIFGLHAAVLGEDRLEAARAVYSGHIWKVDYSEIRMIVDKAPEQSLDLTKSAARNMSYILRSVRDRKRAFESNVFTIFHVRSDASSSVDFSVSLLAGLENHISGKTQVIFNRTQDEFPEGTSDFSSGSLNLLHLPGLNESKDYHRLLGWIHEEARHIENLIFFVEMDPHRGISQELMGLLSESSRQTVTVCEDSRVPAGLEFNPRKDRVYLQRSHEPDQGHDFDLLKQRVGKVLGPVLIDLSDKTSIELIQRRLFRREVGVVFGGGGAKCPAHIGVMAVLEEEGIPVHMVAGSSSGALIGGLWCHGYGATELEKIYLDFWQYKKQRFPDWVLPFRGHVAGGKPGSRFLLKHMGDSKTYDCKIPFYPVAVDFKRGKDIPLYGITMERAIFGCQSIPGFLPLVPYEDTYLADTALANNVPSSVLASEGAAAIISVNISPSPEGTFRGHSSVPGNILRSSEVMMHQTTSRHVEFTDIEIKPDVGMYGMFDFDKSDVFIKLGREATQKKIPEIRALLEQRNLL